MTTVVILFGVLMVAVGGYAAARPLGFAESLRALWFGPYGVLAASGLRVVAGLALVGAAAESRFPLTLSLFGATALFAAALLLLAGRERFDPLVRWFLARSPELVRAWGGVAVALGAFFIYAVV